MLDGVATIDQSPQVWPAHRYDGASRINCPQGARFRLPYTYDPGSLTLAPLAPGERRTLAEVQQMVKKAMRDYGIVFVDTAGSGGITYRMEAGSPPYLPDGFNPNTFMKSLPFGSMQRIATGSDATHTPTA